MIEEVHGAIFDLVELVKIYQSKNRLARLLMSTLFKRRMNELDAVVDRAILRLQASGTPSLAQLRTWWCGFVFASMLSTCVMRELGP